MTVNAELVRLYWDIGLMIRFYRDYSDLDAVLQPPVAELRDKFIVDAIILS